MRDSKGKNVSIWVGPEVRAEIRSYALERTKEEIARTGDPLAHVGSCTATREVLERFAAGRRRKREEAARPRTPSPSPSPGGTG